MNNTEDAITVYLSSHEAEALRSDIERLKEVGRLLVTAIQENENESFKRDTAALDMIHSTAEGMRLYVDAKLSPRTTWRQRLGQWVAGRQVSDD